MQGTSFGGGSYLPSLLHMNVGERVKTNPRACKGVNIVRPVLKLSRVATTEPTVAKPMLLARYSDLKSSARAVKVNSTLETPPCFKGYEKIYKTLVACEKAFQDEREVIKFMSGDGEYYNELILALIEVDFVLKGLSETGVKYSEIVYWLKSLLKESPIAYETLPLVLNPEYGSKKWESAKSEVLKVAKFNYEKQKEKYGVDCFLPQWMFEKKLIVCLLPKFI